jgi:hypothetical protein
MIPAIPHISYQSFENFYGEAKPRAYAVPVIDSTGGNNVSL